MCALRPAAVEGTHHAESVRILILSHLYPIAERYDVKRQAGRYFKGRILVGRDLMTISV